MAPCQWGFLGWWRIVINMKAEKKFCSGIQILWVVVYNCSVNYWQIILNIDEEIYGGQGLIHRDQYTKQTISRRWVFQFFEETSHEEAYVNFAASYMTFSITYFAAILRVDGTRYCLEVLLPSRTAQVSALVKDLSNWLLPIANGTGFETPQKISREE